MKDDDRRLRERSLVQFGKRVIERAGYALARMFGCVADIDQNRTFIHQALGIGGREIR
jgi:hypothetical protein